MYKGKAYNIFLCYRGKVKQQGGVFGRLIYNELSEITEFEPFFAPAILKEGVDNFKDASRQALEDVKVFVLLLTPGFFEGCSADDDMVRDEITTALKNKSMRFIPINMPGFDAKTEYTQDVHRCFESDFTDRVEHIASVPCSDPATFRATGKLQKAIESAIKAYDADSSGQTPFANQSKATPVALKKQSAKKHVDVKFADNEGEVQKPNLISDGASMMEIKDGVLIKGDKNLTGDLVIPAGVTQIRHGAFLMCNGLTSITIPDSVTSVEPMAFLGCNSLSSIYYTGDIASWCGITWQGAIMSSGLTLYIDGDKVGGEIVIPDGTTSISSYAFAHQADITSIKIPGSVTEIGWHAFDGCTGLTFVKIPGSVTKIGWHAFDGCTGLTFIRIPKGVTSIGNSAFSGCAGLTSVIIPDSVTSIGEEVFSDCGNLTIIKYAGTIEQWRIIEKGEDWAYGVKCRMVFCRNGLVRI